MGRCASLAECTSRTRTKHIVMQLRLRSYPTRRKATAQCPSSTIAPLHSGLPLRFARTCRQYHRQYRKLRLRRIRLLNVLRHLRRLLKAVPLGAYLTDRRVQAVPLPGSTYVRHCLNVQLAISRLSMTLQLPLRAHRRQHHLWFERHLRERILRVREPLRLVLLGIRRLYESNPDVCQ